MSENTLHLPKRRIETGARYHSKEWKIDAYGCYVITQHETGRRMAFIQRRPSYCDRGRWQASVECIPDIDAQDGFPRYYMTLEHAIDEITSWLNWRLFKTHPPGE